MNDSILGDLGRGVQMPGLEYLLGASPASPEAKVRRKYNNVLQSPVQPLPEIPWADSGLCLTPGKHKTQKQS